MKYPGDGIYETKSFPSCRIWPEDRRVYIQGNRVQLVNCPEYSWQFNFFFEVNKLGARIGDLPENFKIGNGA